MSLTVNTRLIPASITTAQMNGLYATHVLALGERVYISDDTQFTPYNSYKEGNGNDVLPDLPWGSVGSGSGPSNAMLQYAVYRVVGYNVAGSPDSFTQLKIDALTLSGVPLENIDWIDLGEAAAGGLFVVDYSTSAATFDAITLALNSGLFTVDSATSVSSLDNIIIVDGGTATTTTIRCTSGELIQATVSDGVVDWGTVPTTTLEMSSVRCASGELIQAVITDGVVDWVTVTDTGGGATTIKATTGEILQATITGGYIEWSTV